MKIRQPISSAITTMKKTTIDQITLNALLLGLRPAISTRYLMFTGCLS